MFVVVCGFLMSKAMARSGVIRVWDKGMSSSGGGRSSSHFENQFESSSLIVLLCFSKSDTDTLWRFSPMIVGLD